MNTRDWIAMITASAILALTAPGATQALEPVELSKAWELSGFKNPESVALEPVEGVLYVSNVDGGATEKDGKGAISKVSLDGLMIEPVWVGGLNGPKGLAVANGRLYVADIDTLIEIDIASRAATRYTAPDAKFLNDVTVDSQGRVYVSDMMDDAIYRLADGDFSLWLKTADLAAPNGLLAEDGRLVVGSWGVLTEGFETATPGNLLTVSLADKSVAGLGSGAPVGNLDGVSPDGEGNYFATDWMAGSLLRIAPSGEAVKLLDLNQGSADHAYLADKGLLLIPMMNDGKLLAYRVGR